MSNNLTLSDAINEALDTGKEATFIYNNVVYSFSPQGILDFIAANASQTLPFSIPTEDPVVSGEVWNDAGILKVSAGA